MRMLQEYVPSLYADMHVVHLACRLYCLRCLSHRLINFGFEESVNDREPRDLLALAIIMPQEQHNVLVREAYARGDATLKAWIAERLPDLIHDLARSAP